MRDTQPDGWRIVADLSGDPWDRVEAFMPESAEGDYLVVPVDRDGVIVMGKRTADRLRLPYAAEPMLLSEYGADQDRRERERAERKAKRSGAPSLNPADFRAALELLNLLVDTEPCVADPEGNCVQHGWYTLGRSECVHARTRRMLAEHQEVWCV